MRIIHSKVCKHFAVQTDVLFSELAHELGVSHAILTCSGIDSLDPECTEITFLGLTVTVSISESFLIGVLCYRPDILSGKEITAGLLKDFLAACP